MQLGINVNYLANLRNAIGGNEPDLLKCARFCEHVGADSIVATLSNGDYGIGHLDVKALRTHLRSRFILKMPISEKNKQLALEVLPDTISLIPETNEVSPSFGLNVLKNQAKINEFVVPLLYGGSKISVFIEPEIEQVSAAYKSGVDEVELNTLKFTEAFKVGEFNDEFIQLKEAAVIAKTLGLKVSLGKALNYNNIIKIKEIPGVNSVNIGHSIITKSIFNGLESAIKQMKELINEK